MVKFLLRGFAYGDYEIRASQEGEVMIIIYADD